MSANSNEESITHASLLERLRNLDDGELVERLQSGDLGAAARELIEAELRARGASLPDVAAPAILSPRSAHQWHGDFEIVAKRLSPTAAHILRARLEADGIPAQVADANTTQAYGELLADSVIGARVLVPARFVAQAEAVVRAVQQGEYALSSHDSSTTGSVEEQRLMAFAQDPEYVQQWLHKLRPGFNWVAAIFGTPWCFYRKLYALGMICLVTELLAPFLFGLWFGAQNLQQSLPWYALVSVLAVRVALGCSANRIYQQRAREVITALSTQSIDESRIQAALRRHGGVNVPGALLAVCINWASLHLL